LKILWKLLRTVLTRRRAGPQRKSALRLALEPLEARELPAITAAEQLFVYSLNRARANPVAYQQETNLPADLSAVAAQPPLAVNDKLFASARYHSDEMAANNYFGHQSAVTSKWPNWMARNQGYALPSWWSDDANYIESIAAGYSTAPSALYALILDSGVPSLGHRIQLLGMDPFFAQDREIGVGYSFNNNTTYRHYWAIHTAYVNTTDVFLTGVVYNDANSNSRFDLNEGLAGVTVTAGAFSTTTNAAGGWSIRVPAGSYQVTVSGGTYVGTSSLSVTVGAANIEVDFLSGRSGGQVNFATVSGDNPPIVNAIANQTMPHTQATLAVPFTAMDPDGDTMTMSAAALSLNQFKQQLGLTFAGDYYLNLWGMNEKWLAGSNQQWYCLLPTGELRRFGGSAANTLVPSAQILTLDSSFYADPSLLWNAPAEALPVTAAISGNQVVVDPASNYAGRFVVQLSATARSLSTSRYFMATVTDSAPVLAFISDQTMKAGQHQITLPLSAGDADGDPVTYSGRGLSVGFALGQSLGLHYVASYYLNGWGMQEKWCQSATNEWYCVLPSGELRKFAGSTSATLQPSALVATLDSSNYANPNQLWNPTARADYQQGQAIGLRDAGSYFLNAWGMNEKWAIGNGQQYYCVLPNGELRRWAGTTAATLQPAALVATLNRSCYDDPSQLWNAPAPVAAVTVVGTQLTVTPPVGFVGTLLIEVSASDGMTAGTRTFNLNVTNVPPVLTAIANQTMTTGQTQRVLTLSASDVDGDTLTFSARTMSLAYQLDQQLGLTFPGTYYLNAWGMNEKWLQSSNGQWYCILSSGELRLWAGTAAETLKPAALVATLGSAYYADPSLLWNAAPTIAATASVSGTQLTIAPNGFVGTFIVEVSASDGTTSTTQRFTVTVS
jgi:hypothetical protein